MIFNFLRQLIRDDEFEQNKIELAETRAILDEYKNFIQSQSTQKVDEKEKVDPDFLVFVWATIGFAFYIFLEAGKNTLALQQDKPISFIFIFWLILMIYSIYFMATNSIFALELTRKYAKVKSTYEYLTFAHRLIIGVVLIFVTVLAIAFIK